MMARKPKPGLFPSTQEQPTPEESPARRSAYLKSLLCIAIRKRVLVKLQFKDRVAERLFEPTVVYLSRKHQLCIIGVEIADPEKPLRDPEIRNFEIGEIRSVFLTEQAFVVDLVIDCLDGKYANGIICSTY